MKKNYKFKKGDVYLVRTRNWWWTANEKANRMPFYIYM